MTVLASNGKATFKWVNVKHDESVSARSSHGVSTYNNTLIIFGGENIPRTPIDSKVHALDLTDYNSSKPIEWKVLEPKGGPVPEARVGHAQCILGSKLIVFGGRQGITMQEAPLNDFYAFDLVNLVWEKLPCDGENAPSKRSFHKIAGINDTVYVFGGCGPNGRMRDLYSFNMTTKTWQTLPTCDEIKGRGGAGFIPSSDNKSLFVVGGFAGEERKDVFKYDIDSKSYEKLYCQDDDVNNTLRPFSVSSGVVLNGVITYFGGEVDPSNKGHEGAGGFSNDLQRLDGVTGKIIDNNLQDFVDKEKPMPRGWTDCAKISTNADSKNEALVLFGGLSGDDTQPIRLNDLWILEVA